MMARYMPNGFHERALEVFEGMQQSVAHDIIMISALIDMNAKFRHIQNAYLVLCNKET